MKRTVQIASCVTLLATRFLMKKQQHVYLCVLYTYIVIYTYHRYIHIIDSFTVIHVSINKLLAFVPSFAAFAMSQRVGSSVGFLGPPDGVF